MDRIGPQTISPEQIQKAAQEAKASNKMLLEWAEKQGRGIIRQMEFNKNPLTLSLHWHLIRQGWLGGFVSGVAAGFQLGFKTASKLTQGVEGVEAVITGTETEVIEARNKELKKMLREAVGEASMCWVGPERIFDSERAEQIANRLYERFATPIQKPLPPVSNEQKEDPGQQRFEGL